jgi:hypothetical protein
MINHGKTTSTIKPKPMRIDDYSVWVYSDIKPVSHDDFDGYEYDMIQYDKDEFILDMYEKMNATMDAIVDIDVALVSKGFIALEDVNEVVRGRVDKLISDPVSGKGVS